MKRIEATSYDPSSEVAIWDMAHLVPDHRCPPNLAISLNFSERTARFFLSRITGDALCDVEISAKDFKRIFPINLLPGLYLALPVREAKLGPLCVLDEVLEKLSWSHNTLEGSLGPSPTPPKDPRIGAEVSFDNGTWATIEEIWEPNARRDYETFWVRDEDGGEHELTESRIETISS